MPGLDRNRRAPGARGTAVLHCAHSIKAQTVAAAAENGRQIRTPIKRDCPTERTVACFLYFILKTRRVHAALLPAQSVISGRGDRVIDAETGHRRLRTCRKTEREQKSGAKRANQKSDGFPRNRTATWDLWPGKNQCNQPAVVVNCVLAAPWCFFTLTRRGAQSKNVEYILVLNAPPKCDYRNRTWGVYAGHICGADDVQSGRLAGGVRMHTAGGWSPT